MESRIEFGDEIAGRGAIDEGCGGVDQGTEARKPDGIMRPQAVVVKASNAVEGIEAATMRVAGSIVKLIELAKDGDGRGGAEGSRELIESGDLGAAEEVQNELSGEESGSHNAIVPFHS